METRRSFDEYRMSDEMWERIKPLLPDYETSPQGAIFYRMRTGCQWNAIPPELAPGSTAHDYFQEWTERGVFEDLWRLAIEEYDQEVGLDWQWQSIDGAMTKAPLGGEKTGKNPKAGSGFSPHKSRFSQVLRWVGFCPLSRYR